MTVSTLPITIQGKLAWVSFDDELFWLNRTSSNGGVEPSNAYICIPNALILHSSFIADSDGGSLLLRFLAPPTTVERSSLPPFKPTKSRATRIVELRKSLDKQNIQQSTHRLAAQLSGPCSNLRLIKIEARLSSTASDEANEWATKLMQKAYPDTKPYRRLRVIINPIGGPGKAIQLFQSRVLPILDAAGCHVDSTITTHPFHGQEIAEQIELNVGQKDRFDAIVCVSGDGMLHEVLNGLAKRKDADLALQVPLVPIPAGSGNGVALNLLGVEQGFNLALASLNAIKGKPMPVDVCIVTQPTDHNSPSSRFNSKKKSAMVKKQTTNDISTTSDQTNGQASTETYDVGYSFLSQAIGLMADLDLGTEHLRMLGDTRFVLGFIGGVMSNKECEVDVYVKLGPKGTVNKAEMRRRMLETVDGTPEFESESRDRVVQDTNGEETTSQSRHPMLRNGSISDLLSGKDLKDLPILNTLDPSLPNSILAPQKDSVTDPDLSEWYRINAPISALYGGKIPFVARDLLQFPFAQSHDQCIDLALMLHDGGRMAKLRGISSAEKGGTVYDPAMVYIKCEAYRVVPRLQAGNKRLKKGGLISIDGEHKPYKPFQVEVDGRVHMRFLSLFGRWLTPDVPPPGTEGAFNGTT